MAGCLPLGGTEGLAWTTWIVHSSATRLNLERHLRPALDLARRLGIDPIPASVRKFDLETPAAISFPENGRMNSRLGSGSPLRRARTDGEGRD